ncbi:MAG: ABC transporter substrate-binding protein [Candidatus Manganitrophus sp.]|nr:ABC transporter substrate-binding protein [Candidatus Manganitrophus sp.]
MKRIRPVAWILALFLVLADSSFGMTAEETVSPKKPQRIVSLTLGTDEILFSLVDPKRIAAVTYLAADPGISHVAEAAKGVPNKIRANMEQVVALQPDLVFVATYTSMDVVKQLTEARLPVVKLELFSSIEGIKRNILTVGQMVGEARRAEEIVAEMDRQLKPIAERVAAAPRRPRSPLLHPDRRGGRQGDHFRRDRGIDRRKESSGGGRDWSGIRRCRSSG